MYQFSVAQGDHFYIAVNNGQQRNSPCFLGSVKANIGHLDAASGLASIAKAVISLSQNTLPPQLYANLASAHLGKQLQLNDHPQPLGEGAVIAISSLGVGGTNAHMIIQAAPRVCVSPNLDAPQLSFKASQIPLPRQLIVSGNRHHEIMPATVEAVSHGVDDIVIDAWHKVSGIQHSEPEQNFFTIGGDSLTAIQLISHINSALSLNLSHTTLFSYPTLRDLIDYVNSNQSSMGIESYEYEEL